MGTLILPQGGVHANIKIDLNYGTNPSATKNSKDFNLNNYSLALKLHSCNGYLKTVPSTDPASPYDCTNPKTPPPAGYKYVYDGPSRACDNNTTTTTLYPGIYYNGFVICHSPFVTPLGVYLGMTDTPLYSVDIWIQSYQVHGIPLISNVQSSGSFTKLTATSTKSSSLPATGYTQLDVYSPSLVHTMKNHKNTFFS